jgi:co-chaperonin GroES (HSP10)|tara:strand:+ start:564 stop:821 length:258 start_codon:yes stop_codon:yes gene_type:complete
VKAINKYIVITQIKEEYKTKSGLLLSNEDVSSMRYHKAIVVNPGTNVSTVKKDDVIYFDKAAGHTMLINDETFTIIEERDVVVVL